jgi:hypothetical protein
MSGPTDDPAEVRQLVYYPKTGQFAQEDSNGQWWVSPMPMTPASLSSCLTTVHWSILRLAKITGRSESTVRQWAAGKVRIPQDVGAWLERVARFVERNPPPVRIVQQPDLNDRHPSGIVERGPG